MPIMEKNQNLADSINMKIIDTNNQNGKALISVADIENTNKKV